MVTLWEVAAEFRGRLLRGRDPRYELQDAKSLPCPAHLGLPSAVQDLAKHNGFSKCKLKYAQTETMTGNITNLTGSRTT